MTTSISNGDSGSSIRTKLNDIWEGLTINEISASKAETAVDVFVYDTSKDSDGGAWRKRTQHTSWYNETLNTATRGSRREFPAVAVIVAEADKVTIYDGDDPSLPMWMVFERGGNATSNYNWLCSSVSSPTSVAAKNGVLSVGSDGNETAYNGLSTADFKSDSGKAFRHSTAGGGKDFVGYLAQRNSGGGHGPNFAYPSIANQFVNDVAMTVLPDAPIDPATGLPVPTIAVATAGGVSVIKDDGTVVDSSSTLGFGKVSFDSQGGVWAARNTSTYILIYGAKADYLAGDGWGDNIARSDTSTAGGFDLLSSGTSGVLFADNALALGGLTSVQNSKAGVSLRQLDYTDQSKGMSALLTSTYNTGWMNGDIKGAFLSDTDDTDLVGSGELVTNGTFDTDVSGWSNPTDGRSTTSFVSGKLRITNDTSGYGYAFQTVSTVVGKTYTIQWTPSQVSTAYSTRVYWGNAEGSTSGGGGSPFAVLSGPQSITFVATTTTTYVAVQLGSTTVGAEYDFDNISVKLADADRSVNNNGLVVSGSITRSPVATGAELVAYSGFSSSNYLEQPYNPDLDFGTGDFCVMGWVKVASDTWGIIVDRYTGSSGRFSLGYTPSGSGVVAEFYINGFRHQGTTLLGSTWRHVTLVRSSGVASLYVDGVLDASFSRTEDVTSSTSAPLIIGKRYDNFQQVDVGASLALLRISATAPTAEQIKKIYEDEKVLFQENAACTLYGTSDAVSALAHDPVTDLLHVGTSAGRSVFQGLRRVSNTTTAVGTAISASNSLVVEE